MEYADEGQTANKEQVEPGAIRRLAEAIRGTSFSCAGALRLRLKYMVEEEKEQCLICVEFEFLYFFVHCAHRAAFGILGDKARIKLQEQLGPLVVNSAIESIYGDWPQGRDEFYRKLKGRESEYSRLTEAKMLFHEFGKIVSDVCDRADDSDTVLLAMDCAVRGVEAMQLKKLVEDTGEELSKYSVIHRFEGEFRLSSFSRWRQLAELSDAEVERWLWTRALEWTAWPSFLSPLFLPPLFVLYGWSAFVILLVASVVWCIFRYSFVIPALAQYAAVTVAFLKWPISVVCSIMLVRQKSYALAVVSCLWPLLCGLWPLVGEVGRIEQALGQRIGYLTPNDR